MLVGREQERRTLRSLVAGARVGQSAVLVLTGEAGIGKTELLHDAVTAGEGMPVLRTTGTESESEVPFGGLLQLLRPALRYLDRIPAPQAAALSTALALRPGPGHDRFAVGAATLSLLSRFAEDRPVLVLVDDAHLLDLPSAQALVFAARRLTADPVVLVAAVREGRSSPLTNADLPVLRLGGLSLDASRDLIAATGRRPGPAALARLHEVTGGNPLALVELADDVDRLDPALFGAPVPVPSSVARAFGRRADLLSGPAALAVLVAAAADGALDVVARACHLLDVDVDVLAEAEQYGLLELAADRIVFRHPLVRSAVWSTTAPGVRRDVHRAVAAALPEPDADRRAWHLGQAALGPDEDVARSLDDAAERARQRSAHAVAAAASERAAQLSPATDGRLQRLVAAGESWARAGLPDRALPLLSRAAQLGPPAALSARITALRGRLAARTGSVEQARDLLLKAGTDTAARDPDEAVMLLGEAILACLFLGDTATALEAAGTIEGVVSRTSGEPARLVAALAEGVAGVLAGRGGPEGIRRAVAQVPADELVAADPRLAPWLVLGPLFLRESATGRDLLTTVVEGLRRRTVVGALPLLLFHLGRDQATTDRWGDAELTYTEGVDLAREAGQTADLAACLAGLAWLEARQGRESACRRHAEEVIALCRPRHIGLFEGWALFALGELELGLGRPEAALAHLDRLAALLAELGIVDVDLSPAPEVVDALVRLGREEQARSVAGRYSARAEEKGQPWALARAGRAVALISPDADLDERFGLALELHARTPDVFERARTQLAYGSRLRRAHRRVDARPPLRQALEALEALGAVPWADQAAVELRATGETVRRRDASALEQLTPQELQVARMLAEGRTTREAAAALFLSPKTVEYHLRHVYVKLGIGSRTELAGSMAERPAGES